MNDRATDVGEYCRRVEEYLTRASGGYLVRIVGPAFEIVRQWALQGVPLSVVYRGIDLKAERHRAGRSSHPLRIEFCEADVRTIYEDWRRAVGLQGRGPEEPGADPDAGDRVDAAEPKKPSLSKHLERAIDRLGHVAGRLDLPEALRDHVGEWLGELTALREEARHARGPARDAIASRLPALDGRILAAARAAATPPVLTDLEREAALELAPYRDRLPADSWQRAVTVTVDRLLRHHFGLAEL
jgi:hypothetical protein